MYDKTKVNFEFEKKIKKNQKNLLTLTMSLDISCKRFGSARLNQDRKLGECSIDTLDR